MSKKKPLVTRETYRREREKKRWQGKLRDALGWDERSKAEETPTDAESSQATRMFTVAHEKSSASSPKQAPPSPTADQKASSARPVNAKPAKQGASERVASAANQKPLPASTFWTSHPGKVDRFLNWGIGLLILGIVLISLIAWFV